MLPPNKSFDGTVSQFGHWLNLVIDTLPLFKISLEFGNYFEVWQLARFLI